MREDYEERRRRQVRTPMLILGSVMIVFYLGLGAAILLFPNFLAGSAIPREFLQLFAAMLLIYGGYRAWRLYADYF